MSTFKGLFLTHSFNFRRLGAVQTPDDKTLRNKLNGDLKSAVRRSGWSVNQDCVMPVDAEISRVGDFVATVEKVNQVKPPILSPFDRWCAATAVILMLLIQRL